MKLPESIRDELKTPLGILLKETTAEIILQHIQKNAYMITVGDATTENMLQFGFIPSLQIIDGYEKREKRIPPVSNVSKLYCENPAGNITQQSIDVIKIGRAHV